MNKTLDADRHEVRQELARLRQELERIRAVRQLLEERASRRTSRRTEVANVAIASAIAACQLEPGFHVAAVIVAARADATLRTVLEAHHVDSPERLGAWLRDVAGQEISGTVRVKRLARDRGGVRWAIYRGDGDGSTVTRQLS
jgi:hypothetical protein